MADYRKKSDAVQAVRWNRIGDPPGDRPLFRGDSRVVVIYKREGVADTTLCVHCSRPMKEHGWLDAPMPPLNPASADLRVDPNSGEHSIAAPPPTPIGYPKIFERHNRVPGKDPMERRTVTSPAEEHEAARDGFHFVSGTNVAGLAKAPDAYPKTFVKKAPRSDDPHNQAPDETRIVKTLADEQKAESEGFSIFVEPEVTDHPSEYGHPEHEPEAFPKSYAKKKDDGGWDHYPVHDEDEEKDAIAKGFHLEHPKAADPFETYPAPPPYESLADELEAPRQKGESQVSRAKVEPGYPRTLVKFSGPNRIVHNQDEEKKAAEDGYRSGVVICPGQFIVLLPSGQLETVSKQLFDTEFVRI